MKKLAILIALAAVLGGGEACAWEKPWAPKFVCVPAKVKVLPQAKAAAFYRKHDAGVGNFVSYDYAKGAAVDLNADGVMDYVYVNTYLGNGLNADLNNVVFVVSDGKGGRVESEIDGFDADIDDVVIVKGKVYFRHSDFFEHFEKSAHNHWVYQLFAFKKNGKMTCANADFPAVFPAVTIFYNNPKFKQIELTAADRAKIADKFKLAE